MRKFVYFFIVSLIIGVKSVSASSNVYYVNNNNVEFSHEEYDYISELYYDGYQESMTQEEFDKIATLDLFDETIEIVEDTNSIVNFYSYVINGTIVTQNGITTKIAKSCSSECLVTITATWRAIPTINSYDVIGFRLSNNVTLNSINKATIKGDNYSLTYQPASAKQLTNGFGYSVKLGGVSNMKISTSMYTSTSGVIYGSYQHAKSNVSLATSKLYTINAGGYGGVFDFYGTAFGKYNNAVGVDITL